MKATEYDFEEGDEGDVPSPRNTPQAALERVFDAAGALSPGRALFLKATDDVLDRSGQDRRDALARQHQRLATAVKRRKVDFLVVSDYERWGVWLRRKTADNIGSSEHGATRAGDDDANDAVIALAESLAATPLDHCEGDQHWAPPGEDRCYCGAIAGIPLAAYGHFDDSGSSSGRTADLGSANEGSNPSPEANDKPDDTAAAAVESAPSLQYGDKAVDTLPPSLGMGRCRWCGNGAGSEYHQRYCEHGPKKTAEQWDQQKRNRTRGPRTWRAPEALESQNSVDQKTENPDLEDSAPQKIEMAKGCTCPDEQEVVPHFRRDLTNEGHVPGCPMYRKGGHFWEIPSTSDGAGSYPSRCAWCGELKTLQPYSNETAEGQATPIVAGASGDGRIPRQHPNPRPGGRPRLDAPATIEA